MTMPSVTPQPDQNADELRLSGEWWTRSVTITGGDSLTRGAVLGVITASGLYVHAKSAAGDGSEVAKAILLEDADASGGDVPNVLICVHGRVNADRVNFGTGKTRANSIEELQGNGIQLVEAVTPRT